MALIRSFDVIPLSEPHAAPVTNQETADGNFGRPRRLQRLDITSTHFKKRVLVAAPLRSALHEFVDAAVFQRNQTGDARQVALAQPAARYFRVVVLVT